MIVHTDTYAGLDYEVGADGDIFATLSLNGVVLAEERHLCTADDTELAALEYSFDLPALLEEAEANMLEITKHYVRTL